MFYSIGYTPGLENFKMFTSPNYRKDGEDKKIPFEFETFTCPAITATCHDERTTGSFQACKKH